MPKYHFDIEQNTEEWDQVRVGKFTASKAADLLMNPTTQGYKNLIDKIFEERFTGMKSESDTFRGNGFTERGHELEPVAIADYELNSFNDVLPVGFVESCNWVGCSPDGLIDDDKLIQIKCPVFLTQYKYLQIYEEMTNQKNNTNIDNDILKKIDSKYYKQMQFELYACDDRTKNIFYSYHPKLKPVELHITPDLDMFYAFDVEIAYAKNEIINRIERLSI